MLKKALLGFLVVLVVGYLGLQLWISSYRITNPELAEQIRKDTIGRIQARDSLGQDPATNGYADLKDTLQRETPKELKAPYLAFERWADSSKSPKQASVLDAYATEGPQIRKAARQFETVLPVLDRALAKPHFIWPSEWEKGPSAMLPNFLQLRADTFNLVAYAEYCTVTGRPARALHHVLASMELGARVAQNGTLLPCMIGVALDSIAVDGGCRILARDPALTAKDYRAALARLDALPMTPRTHLDRMDEEFEYEVKCLELLVTNPRATGADPGLFTVWRFPGLLQRERSILTNLYLLQRPSLEKMRLPSEDGIDMARAIEDSHSFLASIIVPNTTRALAQFRAVLSRIGGFKLLCALEVHRLEKGAYPNTLEQLVPSVLPSLPHDYLSADGKYTYKRTSRDFQLSTTPAPALARFLDGQSFSFRPPAPRP